MRNVECRAGRHDVVSVLNGAKRAPEENEWGQREEVRPIGADTESSNDEGRPASMNNNTTA
jgi:hypothetical protein